MPFVKVQKNKAYFKRFQVKFARRRQGKTDYRARKRLVAVDKNKYESTHRYRLVARLTGHYVIAQIIMSEIKGDKVVASAYSSELARYGIKVGLKNYAAAYATGLLLARRLLAKFNLADTYKGVETKKVDGKVNKTTVTDSFTHKEREFFVTAVTEGEKKPFRAALDVGIRNTTTGARVFAVMKGASDGGLDIPHNEKRFPGYNAEKKTFDATVMKGRIFGTHVAAWMKAVEEKKEADESRFSQFKKAGVTAAGLEALYKKVHDAIRANPAAQTTKAAFKPDAKWAGQKRKTDEQRKASVLQKKLDKLTAAKEALAEVDEE